MSWCGNQSISGTLVSPSQCDSASTFRIGFIVRVRNIEKRCTQVHLEFCKWRVESSRKPTNSVTGDHSSRDSSQVSNGIQLRIFMPVWIAIITAPGSIRCSRPTSFSFGRIHQLL